MNLARTTYDRVVQNFDKGKTLGVTFSAGISQTGPDNFIHLGELVKNADTRMHKAKEQSKKPGHVRPELAYKAV